MTVRNRHLAALFMILLVLGTLLVACGTSSFAGGSSSAGTDGLSLMRSRCSVCHSLLRVTTVHKSTADWKSTVDRMVAHGAQLNATEEQTLVDYLAATYK